MWIEIGKPLIQKLLINVAYCPNVNLSNFFLDEMTVEISNVYSYTDNLILLGDYNINLLGTKGRQSLDIFTTNNGLCYVNETEATWTNGEKYSLIDHCFIWKNQIFEASVLESTLGVDHFTIVYQSSLKIDHSDKKRQFLIRNTKKYSRSNFNRDIALKDWSPMYQINEPNEMFSKFIEIIENILSCHAPLKLVESSTKKQQKQWLTKELRGLINEKHRLFNAWKKNPRSEIYNIYKSLRNSVNRKLKRAADDYTKNFFQPLPTSREQWKFIKNRINSNSQIEKIDKLREDSHFVEDDREIANVLNNCFARLGLYKGKDVAPNCSSLTFDGPEFSFRPVTRKELYNVIDNLPKHKSP